MTDKFLAAIRAQDKAKQLPRGRSNPILGDPPKKPSAPPTCKRICSSEGRVIGRVTRFAALGAKNALLYSTFQRNIFFEKTISKMPVQAVQRYKPYRTGPVAVPLAYHRDSRRYGLNQKTRNCIGVFRKNFFYLFCFAEKVLYREAN